MGCKECGKPKCNGKCGCNSPKVLQINNPAEYITFHKVSIPAAMGDSTTNPPKIGAYRNALVYYEADHTSWMYSTDGIPTLVTGEQGETGPQGPAATVAVGTTTTGEPGTQARVYNSGTDSNAVLNFEIPRGDVGPMPTIAQTTGQAIDQVMSQKATTVALATKQNTIDSSHKLSADLVDDTTTTHKFVTASDKTTWNAKQNALTAGDNITISGDTISATDTTYTAGNGLNLNGTEFSADTDVLAAKEDLEDYYTKPEADNLLAPKLEAEVVAELPTTGTEGKLYLTPKAHTIQPATGNPITTTVAGEAGKIESFQLDGDTFQQSYTGKNLMIPKASVQEKTGITITPNSDGSFTLNGTATETTDFYFVGSWQNRTISYLDMPSGDYTISLLDSNKQQIASPKFRIELYDRMGENSSRILWLQQSLASPQTTTISSSVQVTCSYIAIPNGTSFSNEKFYIQLETGSTATSFEPFVGGQASPNPDYPQQIQTVTGTQTISINGTNYPISLGSIELCKLGTYQDYIYKDGESWKVHKATVSAIIDGSESWSTSGTNKFYVADIYSKIGNSIQSASTGEMYASHFTIVDISGSNTLVGASLKVDTAHNLSNLRIRLQDMSGGTAGFRQMLSAKKPSIYARRLTPTDTTITDSNLIAQLEAIRTASLQNGTNTITNTATGSNLAGDMEIGYFESNPTNRYDKFIWLDIDNEYEQIGG